MFILISHILAVSDAFTNSDREGERERKGQRACTVLIHFLLTDAQIADLSLLVFFHSCEHMCLVFLLFCVRVLLRVHVCCVYLCGRYCYQIYMSKPVELSRQREALPLQQAFDSWTVSIVEGYQGVDRASAGRPCERGTEQVLLSHFTVAKSHDVHPTTGHS